MPKTNYSKNEQEVLGELLRLYICFHYGEDMETIRLWGVFQWGQVSQMIKKKYMLSDSKRENKIIWSWPNKTIIHEILKPALSFYLNDHPNPEDDTLRYDRDYRDYVRSAVHKIKDSEKCTAMESI